MFKHYWIVAVWLNGQIMSNQPILSLWTRSFSFCFILILLGWIIAKTKGPHTLALNPSKWQLTNGKSNATNFRLHVTQNTFRSNYIKQKKEECHCSKNWSILISFVLCVSQTHAYGHKQIQTKRYLLPLTRNVFGWNLWTMTTVCQITHFNWVSFVFSRV